MTTTIYRVAFPHPSVAPRDRCCLCEIGSQTCQQELRDQLYEEYPKWVEDLKQATFFKVTSLPISFWRPHLTIITGQW